MRELASKDALHVSEILSGEERLTCKAVSIEIDKSVTMRFC
jgi:hypothetical protein